MLFFFKKKPVEIIAFTGSDYTFAHEFSPIVPARDYLPEWFKKVPSSKFSWETLSKTNTVKSCPGIINSLISGYIMPAWSDLAFKYDSESFRYQYSDNISKFDYHPEHQAPGFYDEYWHFKMTSPWIIKTPVRLQYSMPFYSWPSPFPIVMPPGIIPPIGGFASVNVFLFCKKEKEIQQQLIKQGIPLLHILPITDQEVNFRCELLSTEEMKRVKNVVGTNNHFTSRGLRNFFYDKFKRKS